VKQQQEPSKDGGRHGSSEIEEDDQDQEGGQAPVDDEAQDRRKPAHDRCSSRQADQGTRGSEAHRYPQDDGSNPGCRTVCDSGAGPRNN
jgi:hypothetical protein